MTVLTSKSIVAAHHTPMAMARPSSGHRTADRVLRRREAGAGAVVGPGAVARSVMSLNFLHEGDARPVTTTDPAPDPDQAFGTSENVMTCSGVRPAGIWPAPCRIAMLRATRWLSSAPTGTPDASDLTNGPMSVSSAAAAAGMAVSTYFLRIVP